MVLPHGAMERDLSLPSPPPPRDLLRVRRVSDKILDLLDEGLPVPPSMTARFAALTGRPWPAEAEAGVTDRAAFARWAATPPGAPLHALSDLQMAQMIALILRGEVPHGRLCYWIDLLSEQLGDPRFADLIFWPVRAMTPREIITQARRRWRGEQWVDSGYPAWLLSDEETWALSLELAGDLRVAA
jgi:hypothetical protein